MQDEGCQLGAVPGPNRTGRIFHACRSELGGLSEGAELERVGGGAGSPSVARRRLDRLFSRAPPQTPNWRQIPSFSPSPLSPWG